MSVRARLIGSVVLLAVTLAAMPPVEIMAANEQPIPKSTSTPAPAGSQSITGAAPVRGGNCFRAPGQLIYDCGTGDVQGN